MGREEIIEKIKVLFSKSEQIPRVLDFADVIKALTGCNVRKIDENDSKDKYFLTKIHNICSNFFNEVEVDGGTTITEEDHPPSTISGWINTEIKRRIEHEFNTDVGRQRAGYPRFHFKDEEGIENYMTLKSFHQDTDAGGLRTFYASTRGLNIDSDGRHIAIVFRHVLMSEEQSEDTKIVYFTSYQIKDLYNLKISTKIEFSASYDQLNGATTLIQSED